MSARVIVENKDKTDYCDFTSEVIEVGAIRKHLEHQGVMMLEDVNLKVSKIIPDQYDYCEILYEDYCLFWGYIERPPTRKMREDIYVYSLVDPLSKLEEVYKWGEKKASPFTIWNFEISDWSVPKGKHNLKIKVEETRVEEGKKEKAVISTFDNGNFVKIYPERGGAYPKIKVFALDGVSYIHIQPTADIIQDIYELNFLVADDGLYIENKVYETKSLLKTLGEVYFPEVKVNIPEIKIYPLVLNHTLDNFTIVYDHVFDSKNADIFILGRHYNSSTPAWGLVSASFYESIKAEEDYKDLKATGYQPFGVRLGQDYLNKRLFALGIYAASSDYPEPNPFPTFPFAEECYDWKYFRNFTFVRFYYQVPDITQHFNDYYYPSEEDWKATDAMAFQNRFEDSPLLGYWLLLSLPPEERYFRYAWSCPVPLPFFRNMAWRAEVGGWAITPLSPRGVMCVDPLRKTIYQGRLEFEFKPNLFEEYYRSTGFGRNTTAFFEDMPKTTLSHKFMLQEIDSSSFEKQTIFEKEWTIEDWSYNKETGQYEKNYYVREFPIYVWEVEKLEDRFYLRDWDNHILPPNYRLFSHWVWKIEKDKEISKNDTIINTILASTRLIGEDDLFVWLPFGLAWKGWYANNKLGLLPRRGWGEFFVEIDETEMPAPIFSGKLNCIASDLKEDIVALNMVEKRDHIIRVDNWGYNYMYQLPLMEKAKNNLDLLNLLRIFENAYVYTDSSLRALVFQTHPLPPHRNWGEIEPLDVSFLIEEKEEFSGVKASFGDMEYLKGDPQNCLDINFPFSELWVYMWKMRKYVDSLFERLVGKQKKIRNLQFPLKDFYKMELGDKFKFLDITWQVADIEIDLKNDTITIEGKG